MFNFLKKLIKKKSDDKFSKLLKEEYYEEVIKSKNELPKKVRIEACTICQLNCPSCYMRKEKERVKNGCGLGYLKFKDFKKFVDENPVEEIELSNNGEIFLNPDLVKIIKYAYKKNVRLAARNGVNLNYLTDEQAEAIVKYQFYDIVVSIDGTNQESYSKYRVNGSYEKVINNIKKIIALKEKYHSDKPYMNWKYIVFSHNEKEIPIAKQLVKDLKLDHICFFTSWNPEDKITDPEFVKKETGLDVLNLYTSHKVQLEKYFKNEADWYCSYLWKEPQINWDGKLLGCCVNFWDDFSSKENGGNVFKDGFMNALNNSKMLYAKNMVTGKAPYTKELPCGWCQFYKSMNDENMFIPSPKTGK